LRVSQTDEITGLDATQHGEIAYVFEGPFGLIHESEDPGYKSPRGGIDDILPGSKPLAAVRMK